MMKVNPDPVAPYSYPIAQPYVPESDYDAYFWTEAPKNAQTVLEVGTKQSVPGSSTHSAAAFPKVKPKDYVKLDIDGGPDLDVDVVGDIHALPAEWSDRFGAFVAIAVWEHLKRPWIASREVARVLAPGGKFLVVTHQTFPIHGYPSDYFRFSREALRLLFQDAGLIVTACDYKNRCLIVPMEPIVPQAHVQSWNSEFPSYIHVGISGYKA